MSKICLLFMITKSSMNLPPSSASTTMETNADSTLPARSEQQQNEEAIEGPTMKTSKILSKEKKSIFLLTAISFVLSLPILGSVIWLLLMGSYDCEDTLKLPKIQTAISIGLLFVFVISIGFVFLHSRYLMTGFLVVMVPLIVMFIVGLALVGAYRMESRTIPASPIWIKTRVHNDYNWNYIKSCLFNTRICDDLLSRSLSLKTYDLNVRKLSPVESGCCKPPATCEMDYINATFYLKTNTMSNNSDLYNKDCDLWKNDANMLCYDCNSCKEGFLRALQDKWQKLGAFLIVMSLLLAISHLLLFLAKFWELYVS